MSLNKTKIADADVEKLKEELRLVMIKIGLRDKNWPSDIEKIVLINHIIENFGGHSHEEFRLAFDMAIQGKLDVEANCFENFSCLYVTGIMKAYRKWATQAHEQLNHQLLLPAPPTEESKLTDKTMGDWLSDVKEKVKSGKTSMPFMPLMIYEWLDKNGDIKISSQQKMEYLVKAMNYRQGEVVKIVEVEDNPQNRDYLEKFNAMKESGEFVGDETFRIKNLAKRMILFDMLNQNE